MSEKHVSFVPYPEYDDPEFYSTIYTKREFHKTRANPLPSKETYSQYQKSACNPQQFSLQKYQEFVRNYISPPTNYNGLLMFWGVGSGKCVTPETRIYCDGQLSTIESIWNSCHDGQTVTDSDGGEWEGLKSQCYINSLNEHTNQIVETNVNRVYRQHISEPINVVKLVDGRTLRLTTRHKLLTNYGWTNDLINATHIAVPKILINTHNVTDMGRNLAYFLGWHMSSGYECFDQYDLIIVNISENVSTFLINALDDIAKLRGWTMPVYNVINSGSNYCLKIKCSEYVALLSSNGYQWGQTISNKQFPSMIMTGSISNIRIFLSAYNVRMLQYDINHAHLEMPPVPIGIMNTLLHLYNLIGVSIAITPTGSYHRGIISGNDILKYNEEIFKTDNSPVTGVSPIEFVMIASIGMEQYDGYVYDLEVNEHHNYIGNGIVCHNTCGVIQIAEGLKEAVLKADKRIYVIAKKTLHDNFIKELYSRTRRKGEIRPGSKQCIGDTYYLPGPPSDEQDKKIVKNIKKIYKFYGPRAFVNHVEIDIKEKYDVKEYFSNCVFIIDEAHNLTEQEADEIKEEKKREKKEQQEKEKERAGKIVEEGTSSDVSAKPKRRMSSKKIADVLHEIFSTASGTKLLMLTATPMKDTADDLVLLINLLHWNDKKEGFNKSDLFPSDDSVNVPALRNALRGYVSYVRGENPATFPQVVDATDLPYDDDMDGMEPPIPRTYIPRPLFYENGKQFDEEDYMEFINVIRCPMSTYQFANYVRIMTKTPESGEKDMKDSVGRQASNIIFPNGGYGKYGMEMFTLTKIPIAEMGLKSTVKKSVKGKTRKNTKLVYVPKTPDGCDWLRLDQIGRYSKKFEIYLKCVLRAKGIIYTYTDFIDAGAHILAMMLEVNGFMRYHSPAVRSRGVGNLLEYTVEDGDKRCAVCGEFKKMHSTLVSSGQCTGFIQAYYVLFTGKSPVSTEVMNTINSVDNIRGTLVKVIIGTRVSGEGVDYKRMREVHIIDPWHNNTRLYQAIGRAARHCSHVDLPPDDQKVTVYRYCSSSPIESNLYTTEDLLAKRSSQLKLTDPIIGSVQFPISTICSETRDEIVYRRVERKDKFVRRIERIMRTMAVDCALNKNINIFPNDKPNSRECDYVDQCNYPCEGSMDTVDDRSIDVNTDTYSLYFSEPEIRQLQNHIIRLYERHYAMDLDAIVRDVIATYPDADGTYIYEALDNIVGRPPHKLPIQIRDKYNRPGHVIYADPYYVFQPDELGDESAPMYYKMTPMTIKNKYIQLDPKEFKKLEGIPIPPAQSSNVIVSTGKYAVLRPPIAGQPLLPPPIVGQPISIEGPPSVTGSQFIIPQPVTGQLQMGPPKMGTGEPTELGGSDLLDEIKKLVAKFNASIGRKYPEFQKLHKYYVFGQIDRLSDHNQQLLYEYICHHQQNNEEIYNQIIDYFIRENVLYYHQKPLGWEEAFKNASIYSYPALVDNSTVVVFGHCIDGTKRYYNTSTKLWSNVHESSVIGQYMNHSETHRTMRINIQRKRAENPVIYGIIDANRSGKYEFKLLDKGREKQQTKVSKGKGGPSTSKRSDLRGKVCTSYHAEDYPAFYGDLGLNLGLEKKADTCDLIEVRLWELDDLNQSDTKRMYSHREYKYLKYPETSAKK